MCANHLLRYYLELCIGGVLPWGRDKERGIELTPQYDHTSFEERIYALWSTGGYFTPQGARRAQHKEWSADARLSMPAQPFTIVIPPPNVTGILHMGHGLNISVQDICIRYRRMRGHETLWVPGCDHAGIATQHVVERILRERGQEREALGRKAFLAEARRISDTHHDKITEQIRRMGASCDWEREAFTLDEARSTAVREVFVRLYNKGYIYRGEYLVNWCAHCHTALSDDEVEHQPETGALYRIRYPFTDSDGGLEVVTTRPETMLGDEAVAVHPHDARHKQHIGRKVLLPLVDRELPVIADSYIDREFGSGVLKVTPAHDSNDFDIAKRHHLPISGIFTETGVLNDRVPKRFRGLTIAHARKVVVGELTERGYLISEERHDHQVGHCYRCGHIIEPLLSTQWFVKMKALAREALDAWEQGGVRLIPSRWDATYRHWLENVRDWCISRQLWWGHRIPVWYEENGDMVVASHDPHNDPQYEGRTLTQDTDVLDTWFSSWLWPFTALGWPQMGADSDFTRYYPTSTLITGYDIIFFWVARMVMAGREFTGRSPFRDVILTGLIRDKQGRKMSKSLGNGIDPLEIVRSHGADALKFSLAYLMAHGQDVRLAKRDFAIGSRFANKIWNAARFILSHSARRSLVNRDALTYGAADHWMYDSLMKSTEATGSQLEQYRFSEAAHTLYDFFWYAFCDWYVEAAKRELDGDDKSRADVVYSHLVYVLEVSLRLLHPFMSFITEELYQKVRPLLSGHRGHHHAEAIIIAPYPTADELRLHHPLAYAPPTAPTAIAQFATFQSVVTAVRTIRSEFSIPSDTECLATVVASDAHVHAHCMQNIGLLRHLSGVRIHIAMKSDEVPLGVAMVLPACEVVVHILDQVDKAVQLRRLQKEHARIAAYRRTLETRLLPGSPFCTQAKPEVVAHDRERLRALVAKQTTLERFVSDLQ